MTIIIFFLILSLLVIAHEFGHFVMARKFGMKVYEFGMGFPPRAVGIFKDPKTGEWRLVRGKGNGKREMGNGVAEMRNEKGEMGSLIMDHRSSSLMNTVGGAERVEEYPSTLYSLNWLPLGGFVKIKGESGEKKDENDSFAARKAWQRITVLVAGVFMNFVLAAVLFAVGFMIGLPTDVTLGVPPGATLVSPPAVVIQQVMKDSPADKAGLKFGDKILTINNAAMTTAKQVVETVNSSDGSALSIQIERGRERMTVTASAEQVSADNGPRLGIILAEAAIIRFPWYRALWQGLTGAFFALVGIFIAFFILIKNLVLGQGLAFDVSGPVGIAAVVGQSAALGINYLINVTAMISLSLAAINILPIPALDGGRVFFIVIEKIFGRPVSMKHEQLAHTIGFVLLMILIVVVTYRDIAGLVK